MTETTKAALIATGIVLGAAFLIGDLHRVILQAVWPYVEALYEYHTR
jgi:hypothetical protein